MKKTNTYAGKRLLALLLTIVMVITVFPISVFATEEQPDTEAEQFENPFTDVSETAWYYEYVMYTYQNGLLLGTSATEFSPEMPMTRAMLVTVLYRLENEPDVDNVYNQFTDVPQNTWYTDAVKWARYHNIVFGTTSTTFAPDTMITREQLVTIFYRYFVHTGYVNLSNGSINIEEILTTAFQDAGKISGYARDAVAWCYQNHLINGKGHGKFDPLGNATRAEVAKILYSVLDYKANYTEHVHSYFVYSTIDATCTTPSYTFFACECGERFEGIDAPALGHDFTEWEDVGNVLQRTCNRCQTTETREVGSVNYNPENHYGHALDSAIQVYECVDGTWYSLSFIDERQQTYSYDVYDFRTWGTVTCSIQPYGMLVQYTDKANYTQTIPMWMPNEYSSYYQLALYLYDDGTVELSALTFT